MGPRRAFVPLFLLLLGTFVFFQSDAVEVDVKDGTNATCLYANWMMKFLITYETNSSDYKNTTLNLSSNVTHDGSVCGNDTKAALLAVQFGEGHSWSVNFTKTNETYQADFITFTYNTNDTTVFPDAKRKGPVTIVVKVTMQPVQLNNVFVCHNTDFLEAESVTQIFWNVTVQAFVQNGTIGKKESRCHADTPTSAPTVPPTVANVTTASTTTASPAPTTAPKPVENPETGNYSLKSGNKTCLLANVGLQLNVSQDKPLLININPKTTSADGACGNTTATLKLNDGNSTLIGFTFVVKNVSKTAQKFYLKEVNVTLLNHLNGSVISNADNSNFSKWDAFLGTSYMCQKEQTLEISDNIQIHTFNLWIQPFLVEENKFSTAQECSLDDDDILIPIVVGAALAGLIAIIVLAYVIGRRKSYAGYQTL
ncbi:lysosome-associated membrane glycoprotein 2 isoform X2 [Neopsephotus bourkii]|uniref:lysosome-associated membrane glycoprotein 2 isoform X2 n=1 Tax=Neopsephotus bourkii TaxID=309878 RepID=UPI002AA58EE1|nr:lysosome-associated membrane glycoprotein 2 isoform X2 [Neopsephotus bourkii]